MRRSFLGLPLLLITAIVATLGSTCAAEEPAGRPPNATPCLTQQALERHDRDSARDRVPGYGGIDVAPDKGSCGSAIGSGSIRGKRLTEANVGDIQNTKILWLKGGLLLLIGIASGILLLLEAPSLKVAMLLALAVWAFCRAYYFAFYVIEHYADPSYRFAGLMSFIGYALRRRPQS